MTRTLLSTAAILSLTFSGAASANDIVDFLRAVSGPAPHAHGYHGTYDRVPVSHARSRASVYRDVHRASSRHITTRRPIVSRRSGVNFSISFGNTIPQPRTVIAPPPVLELAPPPGSFSHLPHQLGQIVTCNVPLEPHVRIKDSCDVAPNAVPVIVAVRNPHLGRFRSRGCVESLVYVEVLIPQCPVRRVYVSPCKTRIRLDYGKYEVDITSRNGCVVIDYDD